MPPFPLLCGVSQTLIIWTPWGEMSHCSSRSATVSSSWGCLWPHAIKIKCKNTGMLCRGSLVASDRKIKPQMVQKGIHSCNWKLQSQSFYVVTILKKYKSHRSQSFVAIKSNYTWSPPKGVTLDMFTFLSTWAALCPISWSLSHRNIYSYLLLPALFFPLLSVSLLWVELTSPHASGTGMCSRVGQSEHCKFLTMVIGSWMGMWPQPS